MAIVPNGVVVKVPGCSDVSPYGLLASLQPIPNVDPHWMAGGIQWEDFLCSPGVTGLIDQCPPATGFTKPAERNNQFCDAEPFVLVGSYKCPPVGRSADEAFEIARKRLLKWEGRHLERTLWTGQVANGSGFISPSFAFGNESCEIDPIDVHPAGAVNPVSAVSLIEDAIGDTSGCGVIHAPSGLAPYFANQYILEKDGGRYYTTAGTQIIFGQGYPGSGPANIPAIAGEQWIFATGPLVMTMSDMFQVPDNIAEGVNRMINDVEIRAERFYAIGYSCALFAVRVSLCDTCA